MTDAELLDSGPTEKSNGEQSPTELKMNQVGGESNHTDVVKSDIQEKMAGEVKELKTTIIKLEQLNADLKEKNDLNEDELADLRDQFGTMVKEAEKHENDIK